ncbi:hypothetical protein [Brumimicrobium mesophilum]|uniref:hypothetical protein n=1 Tax=Brumimicrobium mesophilum TaxID=392717 RepID=UPI000D1438C8|nr:hypothetical protein [Brumimicrobium mesophilum]
MKIVLTIIIILNSLVGVSQTNPDSIVVRQIIPSDTDPLINLWTVDSHYVFMNPTAIKINKLFVFLPSSYGTLQHRLLIAIATNSGDLF